MFVALDWGVDFGGEVAGLWCRAGVSLASWIAVSTRVGAAGGRIGLLTSVEVCGNQDTFGSWYWWAVVCRLGWTEGLVHAFSVKSGSRRVVCLPLVIC